MKQLFNLFFALLLSLIVILPGGCKDESANDPHPDVTASSDTIYGTVKYKVVDTTGTRLLDWDFGPAMVRATAEGDNIATAALSSDGTFVLILPETVAGKYFVSMMDYAQTLGGSIMTSPESLYFNGPIIIMVDYSDKGEAKNMVVNLSTFVLVNNKPVVNRFYTYNIYDQNGSFAGTDYYGNVFNWTFTKGWGIVESYGISTSGSTTSKSVNATPADAVWVN